MHYMVRYKKLPLILPENFKLKTLLKGRKGCRPIDDIGLLGVGDAKALNYLNKLFSLNRLGKEKTEELIKLEEKLVQISVVGEHVELLRTIINKIRTSKTKSKLKKEEEIEL